MGLHARPMPPVAPTRTVPLFWPPTAVWSRGVHGHHLRGQRRHVRASRRMHTGLPALPAWRSGRGARRVCRRRRSRGRGDASANADDDEQRADDRMKALGIPATASAAARTAEGKGQPNTYLLPRACRRFDQFLAHGRALVLLIGREEGVGARRSNL